MKLNYTDSDLQIGDAMGKLRCFQIDLDNPQAIFWSGQHVTGRATVDLAAEMKMRGKFGECIYNSITKIIPAWAIV